MKEIYPEQMQMKYNDKYKSIFTMYDGKELSQMTFYHLFPGLDLIYNKFNTEISPTSSKDIERDYVEINYCKRGIFECTMPEDKLLFLGEGEISANINKIQRIEAVFTKGYYEGIELLISIEELEKNIPPMFSQIIDNIKELKTVLLNNNMGIILKPIKEMIHIFDELYYINPEENKLYAQIKVLELLLVFTTIPMNNENKKKRYIEKAQVDKIKKIHDFLISNLDKKITIEMLSKKYNIGTTPLKIYFKEIYGEPIYTYLKDYKIHRALHLLEETNKNISEIAGIVGYDNSSKFAKVFKDKLGCTPTEYKKQKVHLEHQRLFGVEIKE